MPLRLLFSTGLWRKSPVINATVTEGGAPRKQGLLDKSAAETLSAFEVTLAAVRPTLDNIYGALLLLLFILAGCAAAVAAFAIVLGAAKLFSLRV
ncbi:MAG TPA: hypothetical protein VKG21_23765 [Casimicrobiaceae bacterium]|nr:hypothetical protein [Casimicrobiaceae bacterium]